jgi:hypothetical protein
LEKIAVRKIEDIGFLRWREVMPNGEAIFGLLLSFGGYGAITLKPVLSILMAPLIIVGSFGVVLIIDEILCRSKIINIFARILGSLSK